MIGSHSTSTSTSTSTKESKRLTTAGLIAVTAATLLMMAWAIFPSAAGASHSEGVEGNPSCQSLGYQFGFKVDEGGDNPVPNGTYIVAGFGSITISGADGTFFNWSSDFGIDAVIVKGGNASNVYEYVPESQGDSGLHAPDNPNEGPAGLSHVEFCYDEDQTSPPPTPGSITVVKQTIPDGSLQQFAFDTDYGPNFSLADGEQNDSGDLDPDTYSVAEINVPAGWTLTNATCSDGSNPNSIELAAGEHVTCTFTNTQTPTTTTTTPGGGGGGGTTTTPPPAPTTTTTTSPTVAPTTIHKSTTTTDEVLPTTVSPRGTAFTGVENVVPIGAIALMLMTSGSGLLWAGSRRKRDQNQDEE